MTFGALAGSNVDPDTITDADAELILTSAGSTIVVDGRAVHLTGTTYRYFYSGFARAGAITASFAAGGWASLARRDRDPGADRRRRGHDRVAERGRRPRTGSGSTRASRPSAPATVDASTITGNEFTLTGADSQNLISLGVTRINATTFRYLFGGALGTGKVTASFVAGGWADSEGNQGDGEDDPVRGHHAGVVVLHRALGRDHPPGRAA